MQAPVFRILEGLAPYEETVTAMAAHAAAIRNGDAGEEVWLLEHHSVLTGGTSSKPEDLVNPGGISVHRTGRGGQWTWHGPGQRVAYVMLDLQRRQPDVRAYVHALEGWIIDVLASFGIDAQRRDGHPGIWVDGDGRMDKVAAIGVRISRWVTWHGIAVNLDPSMDGFRAIIPCGVRDGGVTSLRRLGLDIDMAALDAVLTDSFAAHFPEPRDG
ncbi:MAG: lipoyl(octanoyl) transferase LipB [Pseudomonadota bacterium]|nr:lipoyl(octanoyl) transferase LipB [Pseudomonadota bacterium]